jgi:hypothetical protein
MDASALWELIKEWGTLSPASLPPDGDPAKFTAIMDRLSHYGKTEWRRYLPAEHPDFDADYLNRLARWIGNLSGNDEDQQLLLEYALHITFFNHDDFCALYRSAFNGIIARWVTQQSGVRMSGKSLASFSSDLHCEMHQRTWYCPVTDSMDINEFYHANHIEGIRHRPGFATLAMLAPSTGNHLPEMIANLRGYMKNPSPRVTAPPLERIVLLEDFVGSGTQALNAVRWAATTLDAPILFVPLVICPLGIHTLNELKNGGYPNLTIEPIVALGKADILGPRRLSDAGWDFAAKLEDLVGRIHNQVSGNSTLEKFGFKDTGCSFVTYSNTPNNTLPLVHHAPKSGAWQPLFPRSSRT